MNFFYNSLNVFKFQTYELNNLPHIHWLRIDLDEISRILNQKKLISSSLILDLSQKDLDKILEIKDKDLYKEINNGAFDINNSVENYQITRWKLWFQTLDNFEEMKKKFELDCVEDLAKIRLSECISYIIVEEKWL